MKTEDLIGHTTAHLRKVIANLRTATELLQEEISEAEQSLNRLEYLQRLKDRQERSKKKTGSKYGAKFQSLLAGTKVTVSNAGYSSIRKMVRDHNEKAGKEVLTVEGIRDSNGDWVLIPVFRLNVD